jgi:NADH:ubiquinone oxidoreductase subunit 6 (subunit J)
MWFEDVIFFVAAIGALAGALGVVLLQNPFYSVLSLVCHLLGLAVLFLLLNAEFIAAAQVVVYAGAVMVLYVFVVAYIGGADEPLRPESGGIAIFGPVFALALAVELCIAFLSSGLQAASAPRARSASCCSRTSSFRSRRRRSSCWSPRWALWCSRDGGVAWRTRARARCGAATTRRPRRRSRCASSRWTSPGTSSCPRSSSRSAWPA